MTSSTPRRALAALALTTAVVALPATAAQAGTQAGSTHTACTSGYVEKAPAYRPISVYQKGFKLTLDGRKHTVASGVSKGLWVHGTQLARDHGKAVTGWTKFSNLCG